jgi:hypothetical protein
MKDEKLIKNQVHILTEIVRKCWVDSDFKTRFLQQPEEVFREYHVKNAKKIQVVENTKNIMYLQIHETFLSKEQLKKISAGVALDNVRVGVLVGAGGAVGLAAVGGIIKFMQHVMEPAGPADAGFASLPQMPGAGAVAGASGVAGAASEAGGAAEAAVVTEVLTQLIIMP